MVSGNPVDPSRACPGPASVGARRRGRGFLGKRGAGTSAGWLGLFHSLGFWEMAGGGWASGVVGVRRPSGEVRPEGTSGPGIRELLSESRPGKWEANGAAGRRYSYGFGEGVERGGSGE